MITGQELIAATITTGILWFAAGYLLGCEDRSRHYQHRKQRG